MRSFFQLHDWISRSELEEDVLKPWSDEQTYQLVGTVSVEPLGVETRAFMTQAGMEVPVQPNISVASNILVAMSERSYRCGKGSVCRYQYDNSEIYYESYSFFQSGHQFFSLCYELLPQQADNGRFKCVKKSAERKYVLLERLSKPVVYFRRPDESTIYIVIESVNHV